MAQPELPDVIRTRMVEVLRTLQRTPEGPDHDGLTAYSQQLAGAGQTAVRPTTPHARPQAPTLTTAPRLSAPTIEL